MEEKILTADIGGEAGAFIKSVTGKTFSCFGTCFKDKKIDKMMGYPHGGLTCEECNYDTSFGKMKGGY